MNSDRAKSALMMLWLGCAGLQVANQVIASSNLTGSAAQKTAKAQPSTSTLAYFVPPHKLLASAVAFTGLIGLASFAPGLAVALGAGVDLLVLLGPLVAPGAGTGDTLFSKVASLVEATA